jgi:hypothetical protein
MIKCNLYGDSFTHNTGGNKGYSTHGKESKYIEWVFDNSSNISFYIDGFIPLAFKHKDNKKKYGWLLESKFVSNSIYENVKNHYLKYFEIFDLIFTNSKDLLDIDERFKFCPAASTWIQSPKIYKKSKMISMIASNKSMTYGHLERLQWVEKIGDQVDLYGRGFNQIDFKEEGLCDYMFSVCIENGFYDGYFTEKILDCFATGTIPVYKGAPNIGDYFNTDGIIFLNDEFEVSEDIYYSKMKAIRDNFEVQKTYPIGEDFIYLNYFLKNDII